MYHLGNPRRPSGIEWQVALVCIQRPNIPRITDFGTASQRQVSVFSLVSFGSLPPLVSPHPTPETQYYVRPDLAFDFLVGLVCAQVVSPTFLWMSLISSRGKEVSAVSDGQEMENPCLLGPRRPQGPGPVSLFPVFPRLFSCPDGRRRLEKVCVELLPASKESSRQAAFLPIYYEVV